jgi:acyl carrier protein
VNATPFNAADHDATGISLRIQDWLAAHISELLSLPVDQVPLDTPFDRYGLDSAAAVGMIGDLGEWLGRTLDPTLPYDYPTALQLADHLAEVISTSEKRLATTEEAA